MAVVLSKIVWSDPGALLPLDEADVMSSCLSGFF
jgi:hypothetical protein